MTNKITTWRSAWALFAIMMFAPLQIMAQTEIDWSNLPGSTLADVTVTTAELEEWEADNGKIDNGEIPDKKKTVFIYNTRLKKFLNTGAKWGTAARLADNGMPCWIEIYGKQNTSCGEKNIYKIHSVYKNYGTNLAGRSDNVLKDNESLSADRGIGVQGDATANRGYQNPDGGSWRAKELWEWCIEKNPTSGDDNTFFIYRPLWVHLPLQDSPGNEPDVPEGNITLIDAAAYNDTRYYNNGEGITNFSNYLFAMHYNGTTAGPVGYLPVAPTGSATGEYIAGDGVNYDMTKVDEWKFISVSDFENAMGAQLSSKGISIDVTYLINDNGFYRTNRYHTLPNTLWSYKAVSTLEQFKALKTDDLSANTHEEGFKFVPAGGSSSENIGKGCDDQDPGQYYCAMMNNPGLLWQEVTVPKTGWYELSVQAAAAQAGDYLMCASTTDLARTLKYEPLKAANYTAFNANWTGDPIFNDNTWGQRSGQYLFEEAASHTSSIRIHLNANETMLIGVLKLSTDGNTDPTMSIPYTAIDNFRLTYIDFVSFVLDEDATDLDYLEQYQKESEQTCYLNRNFVAGNWNTIILPVSLTKTQFKTAFDNGTTEATLGELTSGSNGVLYFTTIKMNEKNDDDVVLASGKPYIIKVAKNPGTAEQQQVDEVNNADHFAVGDVYYKFEGVTFNADSYTAAKTGTGTELRPSDGNDDILSMTGSYVRRYNGDPQGKTPRCYTLNKGAITYYANGAQLKGFRAWITDADDPVVSGTKGLNRFATTFNFIDASQNVTYIDGVPAVINDDPEAPIYNMSGQRMPADNLPKGIYIKGGKKYIVR